MQVSPGPFCVALQELGVRELRQHSDDTLAIAVSKTLSFVSDPGISYLLPASLQLWQVNFQLTC